MRMLSLFAGVGGIDLAASWYGIETVGFVEIEPYPQRVLSKRFPNVPIIADVRDCTHEKLCELGVIDDERPIDIVCGGFPCQPFSVAGERRGSEDDRYLWPEMRRVIDEVKSRYVVAENVVGIINMALDDVLSDLESIGYTGGAVVVPACAQDGRHRRDRVFIVAHTTGTQRIARAEVKGIL